MNNIVMSDEFPAFVHSIQKYGYNIVQSDTLAELLTFEQKHSDIQCLKIMDTIFTLKNCNKLTTKLRNLGLKVIETNCKAKANYPYNVLLNCIFIGNKLFGKKTAIDINVVNFCKEKNIDIVNVNQGYAKCSTAVIDDKFITADTGIYKTLTLNGFDGLLISQGQIRLNGVDYGFIGGCCFSDEQNVYFTGDITLHSDYEAIKSFCKNINRNIICLSNEKLYDIGGFILL